MTMAKVIPRSVSYHLTLDKDFYFYTPPHTSCFKWALSAKQNIVFFLYGYVAKGIDALICQTQEEAKHFANEKQPCRALKTDANTESFPTAPGVIEM